MRRFIADVSPKTYDRVISALARSQEARQTLTAALTAALPFLEQLERSDRVVEVVELCREALRRAG